MKRLTNLVSVFLILQFIFLINAVGADRIFCDKYAGTAVEQYNLAIEYKLPGIYPPVWSGNTGEHYHWCMTVSENVAKNENAKRKAYLDDFLPKKLKGISHGQNILPQPLEMLKDEAFISKVSKSKIRKKYAPVINNYSLSFGGNNIYLHQFPHGSGLQFQFYDFPLSISWKDADGDLANGQYRLSYSGSGSKRDSGWKNINQLNMGNGFTGPQGIVILPLKIDLFVFSHVAVEIEFHFVLKDASGNMSNTISDKVWAHPESSKVK